MSSSVASAVKSLRGSFEKGLSRPYEWRMKNLQGLGSLLKENEGLLVEALTKDLRRPKYETVIAELSLLHGEIREALSSLSSWMKPEKVSVPFSQLKGLSTAEIVPQPLGVTLIIGAWNYPYAVTLGPLIGAIAAGNCVIVKPSEVATNSAEVMAELLPKYLDTNCVAVITGGIPETTELLKQKFDLIFYTGNGSVGRIIMKAAAENLTPVVLELGGKSPCIVHQDANLDVAARRIVNGKFVNCGQTCIAPDYVLLHKNLEPSFFAKVKEVLKEFYGEDPQQSPHFARIINSRHVDRLKTLLEDRGDAAEIVAGGKVDEKDNFVAPTIIRNPSLTGKLMQDEIFGPLLPVLLYDDLNEAIGLINSRPRPLALYLFTADQQLVKKITDETTSGGMCVNDTLMHYACSSLPFGGVGESGMGSYHGKKSFDAFSHKKAVLNKSLWMDLNIRYPPYDDNKLYYTRSLI